MANNVADDHNLKKLDGLFCPKIQSIIREYKNSTSYTIARIDRCGYFTLIMLWRIAHDKYQNPC